MLISRNWLQEYFKKPLLEPDRLAELLTFHVFEIEGIERKEHDDILDVKVLPDRACYALSYRGIAHEVSAITGFPLKKKIEISVPITSKREVAIFREAPDLCTRYIGRYIENVKNSPSPQEIIEKLVAMGGNTHGMIVDAANFVMFDIGQPLHAFDAERIVGAIRVRRARDGEKITTLDGTVATLAPDMLVIADDAKEAEPLAIAGVKGGLRAAVTGETRNIILEAAHFNPTSIRRTSAKLGIRTDASKRFENEITPHLVLEAMERVTALIVSLSPDAKVGKANDSHDELPKPRTLNVSRSKVESILGITVSNDKFEDILSRLSIGIENKNGDLYVLSIPHERLDLTIPEDIAEEVGRLIGYDKVGEMLPPPSKRAPEVPKAFYYEWKIREFLVNHGFSEIMTSSFRETGDVAIEKPLAEDKKYLRKDLSDSFRQAFEMNTLNAPLLGADTVDVFEMGRVFHKEGESYHLMLGTAGSHKKAAGERLADVIKGLKALGISFVSVPTDGVLEIHLTPIVEKLPVPQAWDITITSPAPKVFVPFSLFPFIARDVALFVPEATPEDEPLAFMREHAGELLVKSFCFDRFAKDGKQSYAYRLVFQSPERTLTDEEVNHIMEKLYEQIRGREWQVR